MNLCGGGSESVGEAVCYSDRIPVNADVPGSSGSPYRKRVPLHPQRASARFKMVCPRNIVLTIEDERRVMNAPRTRRFDCSIIGRGRSSDVYVSDAKFIPTTST